MGNVKFLKSIFCAHLVGLVSLLVTLPAFAAEFESIRASFRPQTSPLLVEIPDEFEAQFVRVYTDQRLTDTVEVVFGAWANNANRKALQEFILRGRTQVFPYGWDRYNVDFQGGTPKPLCTQFEERPLQQPRVQGVCMLIDVLVPPNTNVRQYGRGVFELHLPFMPPAGWATVPPQDFSRALQAIRSRSRADDKVVEARMWMRDFQIRGWNWSSDQLARLITDTGFGSFDRLQKSTLFREAGRMTPEIFGIDLQRVLRTFGSFDSFEKVQIIRDAPVRQISARDVLDILRMFSKFDSMDKLDALEALASPLMRPTPAEREWILREFSDPVDRRQAEDILWRNGK